MLDGIIIYQLKGLRFLRLQLVRYALFCTILINHIFVDIELVGEDAVVDRRIVPSGYRMTRMVSVS